MKVVIVDDEPKLRQGLQTLIPWKEMGFVVAGAAANGVEALEVIERERPDIAFVDIRMPLMDGLQLIRTVVSKHPDIQIIILSGYADFDYAKQAIKSGVAGYLLKPVDTEELSHTLEQVKKRIQQKRQNTEQKPMAKPPREWLLRKLLGVSRDSESQDIASLKNMLHEAGMLWESYEVILLSPRAIDSELPHVCHKFADALKPAIQESGRGEIIVSFPYVALLLREPLRGRKCREQLYRRLQSASGGTSFAAAVGGAVAKPEEVGRSFLQAQKGVEQAFFAQREELLPLNTSLYIAPNDSCSSDEQIETCIEELALRLSYSLDASRFEAIASLMEEAAALFFKREPKEHFIKESFFHLVNAVVHKRTKVSGRGLKRTEEVSQFLQKIFTYDRLVDLMRETQEFLLSFAKRTEPEGREKELHMMLDIIHNHYDDNLKLETLAGVLNYSPAYLGQMFKNKTGEYFNTYLDKVRIRKAKELLAQGLKVYEVARRVGYANVNYFHEKFKKYEGRSPSNFKNP